MEGINLYIKRCHSRRQNSGLSERSAKISYSRPSSASSSSVGRRERSNSVCSNQGDSPPSNLTSKAWVVFNGSTGKPICSKSLNERREIASLTKIMTCYTSLKLCELFRLDIFKERAITSKISANINGTRAELIEGDSLCIWDLLHGLMLPSGNDAAICLAEHFGALIYKREHPSEQYIPKYCSRCFISEMNYNAQTLGMNLTRYNNPHGLSNYLNKSTVLNIGRLFGEAIKNKIFRDLVSCEEFSCKGINVLTGQEREFKWTNTHKMLGEKNVLGGKTGVTPAAGPCLCTCFQVHHQNIIVVLLNTKTMDLRYEETKSLLEYGMKELQNLFKQVAEKENIRRNAIYFPSQPKSKAFKAFRGAKGGLPPIYKKFKRII